MSTQSYFELDGVAIPYEAHLEISQTYEVLKASTWPPIRMMDGSAKVQTAWGNKLKTTITGRGWMPAAWDGLNYNQPMLLKCAGGRVIGSQSNAISIPSARRSETFYAPHGYAIVNGERVDSPVNMAGDTATVDIVASATGYGVIYYPEITVYAKASESNINLAAAEFGWQIDAEEI